MGKLGKPERRIEPLKIPVPEKETAPAAPQREREKEPVKTLASIEDQLEVALGLIKSMAREIAQLEERLEEEQRQQAKAPRFNPPPTAPVPPSSPSPWVAPPNPAPVYWVKQTSTTDSAPLQYPATYNAVSDNSYTAGDWVSDVDVSAAADPYKITFTSLAPMTDA